MPNNITNHLSAFGPPNTVSRFIATARGRHPKSGGNPPRDAGKEKPETCFNFHSLVPLPPEYATNVYGDMSPRCGWNLEVETWGIKWGAYEHDKRGPVVDPGCVTYRFRTAWKGCHFFLRKVAPRWSDLHFLLSWGGEGPTRGTASFHGHTADVRGDEYRDEDYPEVVGDTDEDYRRYKLAEALHLNSHARRLAIAVGRFHGYDLSAMPFAVTDWLIDHGYSKLAKTLLKNREVLP